MGFLLRSSALVHEPIELSFGVVSVVGTGIDVPNGVNVCLKGKGQFVGLCAPLAYLF